MANPSSSWERIRQGDREALATFVLKHQSRILRRIRGKLRANSITVVDAEDVISSCARRLDVLCVEQRLVCMDEKEFAAYINRMAMNVAADKIRSERGRRGTVRRLWRDSPIMSDNGCAEPDEAMVRSLLSKLSADDRCMLELRLRGLTHAQIAEEMIITLPAERKRWQRLRTRVKSLFSLHSVPPRDSHRRSTDNGCC